MKTKTNTHAVNHETTTGPKYSQIKLGLDIHADHFRVVRQLDHATPQPAQRFTPEEFLLWAKKQTALATTVHSCYEAGPFGYTLHRQLEALGIRNLVIRPQNWDELGKGVKTDKTDALALVQRLDRYVQGNTKALAVVCVPTPEQEQARSRSRRREQLQKDRQTHEAQGRSLLLYYGFRVRGQWWQDLAWDRLVEKLPPWLGRLLHSIREQVLHTDAQLEKYTRELEAQAEPAPKGFGRLTTEVLEREVFDWHRFTNRRQVASLTGMCPRVRASGLKSQSGAINKQGNPRLRRLLVELAWRVVYFQPDYPPVRRWRTVLDAEHSGGRKKAIVAIGRRLAIDLWRIRTGRMTAAALHLV